MRGEFGAQGRRRNHDARGGRGGGEGAILRLYGGRFRIARAARLDEPRFHVVPFGRAGRRHDLRYAAALMFDRMHRLPDVRIVPVARVRLVGVEGEAAQGDGDIIGALALAVALSSCPLPVIA